MKNCKQCGKPLKKPTNLKVRNIKYCDIKCRNKYHYENVSKPWGKKKRLENAQQEDENKIQCLICGLWFVQVGSHIVQAHDMTAREYREYMKLEVKRGLTRGSYRKLKAEQVMDNGTVKNLEKGAQYRFKKGQPVPHYIRSEATLEKIRKAGKIALNNKRKRKEFPTGQEK